jgi:UDP-N-acetylglucosamine 1-carboxyvinyltransferase
MLKIRKSDQLSGEVTISGSKNAVLPIMAAALLIKGKTTLNNVPDILDVGDFIHFFESL